MRLLIAGCLYGLLGLGLHAQFHYQLISEPDSAIVTLNGTERCTTPCLVKYRWKEAVNGTLTLGVSAPGYKAWTDTIDGKPMDLTQQERGALERDLKKFSFDSTAAIIAFDKLLAANFNEGTVIGSVTDKAGNKEILKWEGAVKIGDDAFEQKFYELASHMGYRVPKAADPQLFSNVGNGRQQLPRYMIGVKLIDYNITIAHDERKDHGAGSMAGRTNLGLEWQVLDRSSGKVVLTRTTDGTIRYRQQSGFHGYDNLSAFEDALIKFLYDEEFQSMVRESKGFYPTTTADGETTTVATVIARPTIPTFNNLSELIQYADRACVTVMTDGGHGSGVMISPEGFVLSSYHVVDGVNKIEVQFSDGMKQQATIVSFDLPNDVVLLSIAGSGYRSLPIGSGETTSMGEEVITIGTPADIALGQSVSRGILSGKRKINDNVYLQTDMSVSPGNSGGPLINSKGEVIGIVQGKIIGSGVEGIGFCIPIERALESLQLRVGGQ